MPEIIPVKARKAIKDQPMWFVEENGKQRLCVRDTQNDAIYYTLDPERIVELLLGAQKQDSLLRELDNLRNVSKPIQWVRALVNELEEMAESSNDPAFALAALKLKRKGLIHGTY